MRVLIVSYAFAPSIGGVETASQMLAEELQRRGHEVAVVTATECAAPPSFSYPVHFQPSPWRLLALHRWADVVLHNSMSLRFAWPLLLHPRKWAIVHTGDYRPGAIRRFAVNRAANITISPATAQTLPVPSIVIANAYRQSTFIHRNRGARDYQFGFVGRLVSDKGADNLLQALALLGQQGLRPRCAIIGAGPEEAALKSQAQLLNVDGQVDFLGPKRDADLAVALNDIDCLVVPSVWNEPFGIVALEGIACGCLVIGSQGGGLKDAIGACGLTYPNGDVAALAAAMRRVLDEPSLAATLRANAPAHLARHSPQAVVDAYLEVMQRA
ncbi:MAG: glycosyl transferase family 1 [Alphaproteobacteria bacterium]|nr:glycosyl transferase family 1 [Alphaproteobacteria bacterium]